LWDAATGKERQVLRGHQSTVWSVAYAPDGKTLASTSVDKTVRVWDVASGKERLVLEGHQDPVRCVVYAPDGKTLASGSDDRTVRLWDVATGKELRRLEGHRGGVQSVAYAPDGKILASCGNDKTVRLWDVATGKELQRFDWPKAHSVAYSSDGKTLAVANSNGTVQLWEVATGKEIRSLAGHKGLVLSAWFSPDGKTLASASADGTALIWAVSSRTTPLPTPLSAEELVALWEALADADVPKAHAALWTLAAAPRQTVPFLREHLPAAVAADPKRVAAFLDDLVSEQFAVREKASQELERLGESAVGALRSKLADKPALELRQRLERLLEKQAIPGPAQCRGSRAVQVMEAIATPEARALLEKLAKGAEGFRLTDDAKSALQRLNRPVVR
jgi:tricorn protease-like protein